MTAMTDIAAMRELSPLRKSTDKSDPLALANEQLHYFGIDPESAYGVALSRTVENLYRAQASVHDLWKITSETIEDLPQMDRVAYFNAKKFLSFQLAKILDTLQNPFRKTYQSLHFSQTSQYAKGAYPVFDNISAIFSATPVVVRTATYIYACTEWVDDAFHGKEPTHQIYSRLLNPTAISLANAIVDLECGPYAADYLAWNFNSGMAAIDATLSHVLNHGDILIVSRNVYGGVHQLLHDYFAKPTKMGIQLVWFDGYDAQSFEEFFNKVQQSHQETLNTGSKIHVYLESPCNPHGYVLDIAGICEVAHSRGALVMLDSTLATPVLANPLMHKNAEKRPDYLIHSYTKDISGSGGTTAGCVIGPNWRMFIPKGESMHGLDWSDSMFWNVYYIKGGFLDSEKALDVLTGMRTLELRMIRKCINTKILTQFLASHPDIAVCSNAIPGNENYALAQDQLKHHLPTPLFTFHMDGAGFSKKTFQRFFDSLEPSFGHQVSIGQCNTIVLCPALTSHSELSQKALAEARIFPTTIRVSMGDENPQDLIAHLLHAMQYTLDQEKPGFSDQFMSGDALDAMATEEYLRIHSAYVATQPKLADLLSTST